MKLISFQIGLKIALFLLQLDQENLRLTDTKRYVLVVTLFTLDNIKLLEQLESGFKRIINYDKYQSKLMEQAQNKYLDYLID